VYLKKNGLRYNLIKKKLYSNFFAKASTSSKLCISCGKNRFHEKYCIHKNFAIKTKSILVLKGVFY